MSVKSDKKKFAALAFIINLTIALAAFVPFIIKGGGMLSLGDDFDAQELVFGMLANREIKEFDIFFNWAIDMGSDFISALGFYNLGSPFFWITLPFKPEVYPWLVGWILILKYAFAGLFSYKWIERYAGPKYAIIGSVLYAFSGYQSMNMVFYHFHDAVVFFPLLMLALDMKVTEKRKGIFAFAVAINALVNWNFFIGEVIFAIIYYVIRFDAVGRIKEKKIRECLTEVFGLLLEGVLGVGISAVIFIPSVYAMLGNRRTSEHISLKDAFVWSPEYFIRMLKAFFIPAEAMNQNSVFQDMNWYSIGAYLPMTGISLSAAYVYGKKGKKDWLKTILIVCLVIAFVPVLNSVFVLFYREPYRRWFYMPILMMALASSQKAEDLGERKEPAKPVIISCIVTALITIGLWGAVRYWNWDEAGTQIVIRGRRWFILAAVSVMGLIITAALSLIRKKEKLFTGLMIGGVSVFAVLTTVITVREYKEFAFYRTDQIRDEILYTVEDVDPDILPYRYAMAEDYYNKNMAFSLPTIDSFISMVDAGIFEFYDAIDTHRHVMTFNGPAGTEELLSARYKISESSTAAALGFDNSTIIDTHKSPIDDILIFENKNTPPIGFTYDEYMTYSEFLSVPSDMRSIAMLGTLVVKDEDTALVSERLAHSNVLPEEYSADMLTELCDERKAESSKEFEVRRTGFTSVIDASSEKYAFFSVPYSKRWSATVNGSHVSILNINGLMAVPVEAGENVIDFDYSVRVNVLSLIISVISLAVTIFFYFIGNCSAFSYEAKNAPLWMRPVRR